MSSVIESGTYVYAHILCGIIYTIDGEQIFA